MSFVVGRVSRTNLLQRRIGLAALLGAAPLAISAAPSAGPATPTADASRCTGVAAMMAGHWPDATTRVTSAQWRAKGYAVAQATQPDRPPVMLALPAHCEVSGLMRPHRGVDGQDYAIRFRLRLPSTWNGRFLFTGGGGTNGTVGDAIGTLQAGTPDALTRGYAVLAQDSGHDNATNSDPAHGGAVAFGRDPVARADYGGTSLPPVTLAAKALLAQFYGRGPRYSYFLGCSKGGQEGMVLAQRYPALFDGIVAAAPGFALPRAALAEAWNVQAFAGVLRAAGRPVTVPALASTFSPAQGARVRQAILAACDADDGLVDGIIGAPGRCTNARVLPQLNAALCRPGEDAGQCLAPAQIDALRKVHDGLRGADGRTIYPGFPWDAGWFDPGWAIWMTGSADGHVPSLNVMLGAGSRAGVFTTPPAAVPATPDALLSYQLAFDPARDAGAILRRAAPFTRSAWQDIGARSTDLSAFRRRGGRLIVPHGMSDPVFSVADTLAWWNGVDRANGGRAASFARVFPVPGMAHCAGGPATDQTDAFDALVAWVEQGRAPDQLVGRAGPASPWPGRERPVCRYPLALQATTQGGQTVFACRPDAAPPQRAR